MPAKFTETHWNARTAASSEYPWSKSHSRMCFKKVLRSDERREGAHLAVVITNDDRVPERDSASGRPLGERLP